MQHWVMRYSQPVDPQPVVVPYAYDASLQLNVLSDGRKAMSDTALMSALGTTTSTAGSQTHFDD
jgi:putative ATP-grasp target RiPP